MNRVAVITGGTGGLGKTVCRAFLDTGYDVVTTYRSDEEFKDLLDFVADKKSHLSAVRINVTDEASLDELVLKIDKQYGYVNVLISLVGGFAAGTMGEGIGDTFDKMMNINGKSFLLTASAIVPLMHKGLRNKKVRKAFGGYANIIGVGARPALEPAKGIGVYAASKATVVTLVKTLAKELKDDNITVNAIAPSTIDTAANRKAMPKADFDSWVKPEVLSQAILFLIDHKDISGTILPVYGKA